MAELLLGVKTDTQDTTGQVLEERKVETSEEEILRICAGFLGEQEQVPPMYSALKVNGKKLYELAREGKVVERKARPITIYELEVQEIALPVVRLRVLCSKGTYIRTLCEDIGEALGCGGAMQSLVRTRVERFFLQEAATLRELQEYKDAGRLSERLIPVEEVFGDCSGASCNRGCGAASGEREQTEAGAYGGKNDLWKWQVGKASQTG